MTTDDFLLDQVERTQRDRTRRRRDGRSRQRQLYLLGGLASIALLVLGGPSLISHSSIGRSILTRALAGYGLAGNADAIRIGWVTPLQITGLKIRGNSANTQLGVAQLDMDLTVTDLLSTSSDQLGQVSLRGVNIVCTMSKGRCSLEQDLAPLLESSSEDGSSTTNSKLKIQDLTLSVTDTISGGTWQVAQSNADVDLAGDRIQATFAGVLTEPGESGGALNGSIELVGNEQWRIDLRSESLPLSVVSLARRRLPELAGSIPERIGGDATGAIVVSGHSGGSIEAEVRGLRVRNLTASDEALFRRQVWKNSLATLDGNIVVAGNRLIGRRLEATTDFAKATMDGAFSTTFSLVGASDNPLRWLEAIDGTATAEVDLAALDQSLPGILPLRDDAELISGRAVARVDSNPGNRVRRSKLSLRSDALRARSRGRAVVIDPIELSATVASEGGQIRAEQFEWKSTFGAAVGQGDLQSGSADIEIDFGRLTAMLRPIIELSEASLAGAARGKIRWNASDDNVWRLSGSGDASNLLVSLPGGQSLKRQSMRAEVDAIGRWGGTSLEELTRAGVTVASNGLDLRAELVHAVPRPDTNVPIPIKIQSTGRLETIIEILGPWLPAELLDATGGFLLNARADASTSTTQLTNATIELTQPRLTYADRYFSQPSIKLDFSGQYIWPSHVLRAQNFTLVSDSLTAAAQGEASPDNVDLQIKWKAKLERLQGSVRQRLASNPSGSIQQVGYRTGAPIETEQWLVMGDCDGDFVFTTRGGLVAIESDISGKNLAVVQPAAASAAFQTVGPMPPTSVSPIQGRGAAVPPAATSSVVWSEPNLKIKGSVRWDTGTGTVLADSLQVAGDWFATTLAGKVIWNEQVGSARLSGPTRLKMNEVGARLSPLAGIQIKAEGIHETPLEFVATRGADGNVSLNVVTNLGWESGEVAGLTLGPATIPVRLTETSVDISPSRVPMGQGTLNLAGQVHYRPGPIWLQLDRGVVADSVRLTPAMTDRWLKYLAPLAADTARIDGTISADLDEALVVFDDPQQSRVSGRLNIAGVTMNAGPLANQLFGGVDQIKTFMGVIPTTSASSAERKLITMPPQIVDFSVDRGVVTHNRMSFEIDRANIITSGRVSFDGRMNMVAQVPLDARWLGRDIQGLAGQSVTLPIDGTLSRPRLDSSGTAQMAGQLGSQAIQSTAENYLQKQLNKGIEKIGLEKIFGR